MEVTYFVAIDPEQATPDEYEFRSEIVGVPMPGDFTWMNPDAHFPEWEVAQVYTYKPVNLVAPIEAVNVAGVLKDAAPDKQLADPDFPEMSITLYLLDGQLYTESVCSDRTPPAIGPYAEYEPLPGSEQIFEGIEVMGVKPQPLTKEVTHYHTYLPKNSQAPYATIYIAYLAFVREPVAA